MSSGKECVLTRIINLYRTICSACSELQSDEGQNEKAYCDREDRSSQIKSHDLFESEDL